jgi:uncharacterized membrane protein YhaH (DUF805 family)
LADESKPVQDSEKGRPPGPGREAGNAGNGAGKSSFTSFAELSALVVIFGVSIYVLGLFAVWVPITLTYTHDFSTAWYAVSLVPQPTMAGFGVRQLLYPLLITILVLIVIGVSSSLSSIGSATGRASEDQSDPDQAKRRSRAVAWMWSKSCLGQLSLTLFIESSLTPIPCYKHLGCSRSQPSSL